MKAKLITSIALTTALVLFCGAALAATANASIVAPVTEKITAPFAGTLLPFDLTAGDAVIAGDTLFELDTEPVYSDRSGTVAAVFAKAGDDAAGVVGHYGALAVIEPEYPLYIDADTENAYDDEDNRYIHAGEMLYLKCGSEKGTGVVTQVNGEDYIVEILTGDYDVKDTVRCFRESAMPSDSEVGRGKVKRYSDISVTAAGRVSAVHISAGDTVHTGDLLFETIDPQSAISASPVIAAPVSGAVTALYAAPGAQVYRGALLAEVADLTRLELSAQVDEIDLPAIHVGDVISYTIDAYAGETYSGTITEIKPIGSARQNAAYFDVRITVPQNVTLLPGMNATVLIGE